MKSIILPVLLFVFTMAITPGPNNMLLTASGARFGYKRTLKLIIGMMLGMLSQLLLCAVGLVFLFEKFPFLHTVLKVIGTVYILYLAVSITFFSLEKKEDASADKPLSLIHGIVLQYINPKAYIMSVTTVSVYTLKGALYIPSVFVIAVIYIIVTFSCISLWACFGSFLNSWMKDGKKQRIVRYFLGALTAASVVFILT
jgi:threonine/homoserine/homoserine lactone efflux protein